MSLESDEPTRPAAEPGSAERPRGQRRRLLDDPRGMRALAHPLRLELRVIVGRAGRITTADAARVLGISHGLASHHLHQLAKYGFVEQVHGADNRERPWRLVATSTSHEGLEHKPGGLAAVQAYEQIAAERTIESFLDWQERRSQWSARWREHAGMGLSAVYLTEHEMAGLVTEIDRLIMRYVEERPIDDLESRPPGSVPVEITTFVIPRDPVTGGS
jgi:DNA-binding MarR family transcriptional regulator